MSVGWQDVQQKAGNLHKFFDETVFDGGWLWCWCSEGRKSFVVGVKVELSLLMSGSDEVLQTILNL